MKVSVNRYDPAAMTSELNHTFVKLKIFQPFNSTDTECPLFRLTTTDICFKQRLRSAPADEHSLVRVSAVHSMAS